ncbi:DUF3857 and transglutaminase domain-containing protein [Flavobacterium sp.]|uniref:DUF3857 and transglutaminase domain-containing protein n=1 Tax=Flavobacterium sp. TaxID=239 RepID=UPI0026069764|nr:DUF3857 and transglutaminase domain-containing protein [Flavobacterium sp.]
MKKIIFTAVFIIYTVLAFAQDSEFGKVKDEEVFEKQNKQYPSAGAVILYKKGSTYFDFDSAGDWILVTDVKARIKIYAKEGYNTANIEIPFYTGGARSSQEEVNLIEAYTYNTEGGRVERTKARKENEFTEEYNEFYKIKKITLPAVKEGSVIEYHYQIKSPFFRTIPTWYFQGEMPINYMEYKINFPQYFTYNRILSPYLPVQEAQETVKVTKRFSNGSAKGGYGTVNGSLQNQTGSITFYEISKKYVAENVPPLKDEAYVDNIKNYTSYVKHELAKTNLPNQIEKNYVTDWFTVVQKIYGESAFGPQLKEKGYFEADLQPLLKQGMKQDEIINTIYTFVKDRMAYNGRNTYEAVTGVTKAYTSKTGSAGDINLMLISMLRSAGINANPVLLSTRDNGQVSFINRDEFNYVIATVESANGRIYLDATDKNSKPGLLPVRALNGTGRLIKDNYSSEEVNLSPLVNSKELVVVMGTIQADGSIKGQVRDQRYDYKAFLFNEKTDGQAAYKNVDISDYNTVKADDNTKPLTQSYNFSTSNAVEIIGGKMYISPMLFFAQTENPFKSESRNYPIDFIYPSQERYTISLTLPDGYTVETLPEPVQMEMPAKIGSFRFSAASTNNQLQIVVTKEMNTATVAPEYYIGLKAFFADMVKKQNEKIVLKKL